MHLGVMIQHMRTFEFAEDYLNIIMILYLISTVL